jgi:hypothetical protein
MQDGAFSAWVTGKRPSGKGWSLDPGEPGRRALAGRGGGEGSRWSGDVAYIRASRVVARRPRRPDEGAAPE